MAVNALHLRARSAVIASAGAGAERTTRPVKPDKRTPKLSLNGMIFPCRMETAALFEYPLDSRGNATIVASFTPVSHPKWSIVFWLLEKRAKKSSPE